jgi:hypothetical protein
MAFPPFSFPHRSIGLDFPREKSNDVTSHHGDTTSTSPHISANAGSDHCLPLTNLLLIN